MISQSSESFVPLTAAPASAGKREFRVAVLNGRGTNGPTKVEGVETKSAFQALEPLRAAIHVGANGMEKKSCEPRVTIQRDGNRVTHLRIQCGCGQIMDLACVYDDSSAGVNAL